MGSTGDRPATYALEDLLTNTGDQLLLPGEARWFVSDVRCGCGGDNGIRHESVHRPLKLQLAVCDACGDDIRS